MSIRETIYYTIYWFIQWIASPPLKRLHTVLRDGIHAKKYSAPLISFMEGMFSWLVLIYMQGLAFFFGAILYLYEWQ